MMKVYAFSTILLFSFLARSDVDAFFVKPSASTAITSASRRNVISMNASEKSDASLEVESEVERLLRKARQLREEADSGEQAIHQHLYEKKTLEDQQLDRWISETLEQKEGSIVDRIHSKRPCMDTMERMIDRLHVRNLIARGHEHVVPVGGGAGLQRLQKEKDEAEADRLVSLVESLLAAVKVLDEEEATNSSMPHAESQHWGGSGKAKKLQNQWQELQRENEEQFLNRQQSLRDAQTIKKDQKAPPKVKDDHRFLP